MRSHWIWFAGIYCVHLYCMCVFNITWRIMHAAAAAAAALRLFCVCIPVRLSAIFQLPCCFNTHTLHPFVSEAFCSELLVSAVGWKNDQECRLMNFVHMLSLQGRKCMGHWKCSACDHCQPHMRAAQSAALSLLFTGWVSGLLRKSSMRLPVCCKGQRGFVLT